MLKNMCENLVVSFFLFPYTLLTRRFPGQEYVKIPTSRPETRMPAGATYLWTPIWTVSRRCTWAPCSSWSWPPNAWWRAISGTGGGHTRTAGPRYDDWSGTADRGGDSDDGGDGTGAFSAQQAPRPGGLLVDSVGAFLFAPVRAACRSLPDDVNAYKKKKTTVWRDTDFHSS